MKYEKTKGEFNIMPMTNNLIRIANAGAGMVIDAKQIMTDDLIRIANVASNGSGKIILKNAGNCMTSNLIRIANAGKGNVIFDFT